MQSALGNSERKKREAFSDRERVWLCLTSLWHRRFVEDLIHIVGMPATTRVRLRYSKEYVDPELWRLIENRLPKGKVVMLIGLLGAAGSEPLQAAPIRRAGLVDACCEGSILMLDVALEEFVLPDPDLNSFWDGIAGLAKNLPEKKNSGEPLGGHFVQELRFPPKHIERDISIGAWEKVAEAVFQIDDAVSGPGEQAHIPFQYFVSVPDDDLKGARILKFFADLFGWDPQQLRYILSQIQKFKGSLTSQGVLVREGGFSFALDVHTITRKRREKILNPLGEVLLEVSHPVVAFTTSRRVRIDSQRDVKTIRLSTSAVFRRAFGHLSVRGVYFTYPEAVPGGKCENATATCTTVTEEGKNRITSLTTADRREQIVLARYDFSLVVGRILPWLASGMVALAAAIAVYKVPENRAITLADCAQSFVVGVLAFLGFIIGLRGEQD